MAEGLKCPVMKWGSGDDQGALTEFKRRLQRWFVIKGIKEELQHDYIIFQAGEKGEELSRTWTLTDTQLKNPGNVWEKLEQSVGVADNFRVHRLNLHGYKQKDSESIDEFYTRCRVLAMKCKFGDGLDDRLIDQLITGTRIMESRRELLKAAETISIDDALNICRTQEATQIHMRAYEPGPTKIDAVKMKTPEITDCKYCGTNHARGRCPAYHAKCLLCGRTGHFRKKCLKNLAGNEHPEHKFNKQRQPPRNGRAIHAMSFREPESDEIEDRFDQLSFDTIRADNNEEIFANVQVQIPGSDAIGSLSCKVDTGAQGNILPLRTLRKMCPNLCDKDGMPIPSQLITHKPLIRLGAYNGTEIQQHGVISLCVKVKASEWLQADYFLVETEGPIIIGGKTCIELGIVTINTIDAVNMKAFPVTNSKTLKDLYPDRFTGIGEFPGTCKFKLKENVKPSVEPPRKFPVHLQGEIAEELKAMESLGVIEKIPEGECTEWLSSITFSRKESGKLRLCLDPRNLNDAIERTYHRTPTIEEMNYKLSGAKVFSKLDAKHGYWSVVLDERSSAMTAFNAPGHRYRFKRLPFGVRVAQDIFQEKMDLILMNCEGTVSIADDIIVFGENEEDHDRNLHRLMLRAREFGLVFNPDKCHIKVPEIMFFGMTYSKHGVAPDTKKVKEIRDMPSPKSVKELQQFLGMVQYLAPFIPHLSEKTAILRDLTKADVLWEWSNNHEKAFDQVKNHICEAVRLNFFDPALSTKIQVDASTRGLGAALIQIDRDGQEKIIAFASKSLTDTETRYANIEREMLAVVFGVERFHTYVYGANFSVESDHKPLENIQLKHISKAPPRLQRMLLRLQPYDMLIKYRPGKELLLADALSRINPTVSKEIPIEKTIHNVKWSDKMLQRVREETNKDSELRTLSHVIMNGWPEKAQDLPKCTRTYWSMKDFLSVEDGVLMKGSRVMIPQSMRKEVLQRLHTSHQGIEKSCLRAQTCVYWRGIDNDIKEMVQGCDICLEYSRKEQKENMIPRDLPCRQWQHVGTDIFEFGGQSYLIVADYYSKMPFVRRLNNETSASVIGKLKTIFSEHGIPEVVFSDGGPCYASCEFKSFTDKWEFEHVMSSPHYPQSNGFIERAIQTVKNTMKKAKSAGMDAELAMLCIRATPISAQIGSPAELLYNRQIKSNLPMRTKGDEAIAEHLIKCQERQAMYYDRNAIREQPELAIGQTVGIQDPKTLKWSLAQVMEKTPEPRSYMVKTRNGAVLRRNRRFLKDIQPRNFETRADNSCGANILAKTAGHAVVPLDGSTMNTVHAEASGELTSDRAVEQRDVRETPETVANSRSRRTVNKPQRLIETM